MKLYIKQKVFSWGDRYELDIAGPKDELVALAVVLTIDCVMESQANASNNH